MPTALKNHRPVRTRSPFFINCVPTTGETITSASLTVRIKNGNRSAALAGTTLKTYTLSKSNAVDGIIVFDIAPLASDYIQHNVTDRIIGVNYDIATNASLNSNDNGSEITTTVDTTTFCNLKVGDKFTIQTPAFTGIAATPCNASFSASVWYATVLSFNATSITFDLGASIDKAYCISNTTVALSYAAKVRADNHAEANEVLFVEIDKEVVDSGGTTETLDIYHTANFGYSGFKDGVNFLPTTGATGNYGTPDWSPAVAKGTDVTIMATNCYRQMGQDSYTILPIFTGEFDRNNPDIKTFGRIKWGAGTNWLTRTNDDYTPITNIYDIEIMPSDFAIEQVEYSVTYLPLGKKNLCSNFVTGKDYLRVGHFINRNDAGSPQTTTVSVSITFTSQSEFSVTAGQDLTLIVANDAAVNDVINILGIGFDAGGGTIYPSFDEELTVIGASATQIQLDISGLSTYLQGYLLELSTTQEQLAWYLIGDNIPRFTGENTIAAVNDQSVLRYEIVCEPKYNVVDCLFVNKFGFWDSFSFIKKSMSQMVTTESKFQRNIGEVVNNEYTYSVNAAQKQRYNVNGSKSIIVNTGFVNESFSQLLEEILLSESIVLIIDDVFTPVTIQTNQVDLKKSVNDNLINYSLTFDFAYNELNNVV